MGVLTNIMNEQETEIKIYILGKKLLLLTDDIIVYIEKSKIINKKTYYN